MKYGFGLHDNIDMNQRLLPAFANPYVFSTEPYVPCVMLASTDAEVAEDVAAILRSAKQNMRCPKDLTRQAQKLTKLLSSSTAKWTLCAIDLFQVSKMVPHEGTAFLRSPTKIQAYVIYVANAGQQRGMCFKLTQKTIQDLIELHKDGFLPSDHAYTATWESTLEILELNFALAANEFVFHTDFSALENLTKDGSGVLSGYQEQAAREAIRSLFVPIVPPWLAGILSHVQGEGWPTDQEISPCFEPVNNIDAFSTTIPEGTYGAMINYDGEFSPDAALQSSLGNSDGGPAHYPQLPYPSTIARSTGNMGEMNLSSYHLTPGYMMTAVDSLDVHRDEFRAAALRRIDAGSSYRTF